jgi:hypothetical protein
MVEALSLIVIIAACTALLLAVVCVSVRLMATLFKYRSGYARLAADYPAGAARPARTLAGQTVQFGPVRYTRCVTLGVGDDGLFVQVDSRALGRHKAIVVPWGEIAASRPATIHTREAVELLVGPRPVSLRVMPGAYAELRSRLVAAAPLV